MLTNGDTISLFSGLSVLTGDLVVFSNSGKKKILGEEEAEVGGVMKRVSLCRFNETMSISWGFFFWSKSFKLRNMTQFSVQELILAIVSSFVSNKVKN